MSGTPKHTENSVLPTWVYPLGFWVALPVLALGVLVPDLAGWAVWWMLLVPTLAAVIVVVVNWTRDRRVSVAALLALLGLAVVFVVKGLLG